MMEDFTVRKLLRELSYGSFGIILLVISSTTSNVKGIKKPDYPGLLKTSFTIWAVKFLLRNFTIS